MRTFFVAIFIGKDTAAVLLHIVVFLSCKFLPFVEERAEILVVKSWRGRFVVQLLGTGNNTFMMLVFAIQKSACEIGHLMLQGCLPGLAESELITGMAAIWHAGIA